MNGGDEGFQLNQPGVSSEACGSHGFVIVLLDTSGSRSNCSRHQSEPGSSLFQIRTANRSSAAAFPRAPTLPQTTEKMSEASMEPVRIQVILQDPLTCRSRVKEAELLHSQPEPVAPCCRTHTSSCPFGVWMNGFEHSACLKPAGKSLD